MKQGLAVKWLSVIGVGEEGLTGLSAVARLYLEQAEIIIGGDRHLAMLPSEDQRPRLRWTNPIVHSIEQLLADRGKAVCVLASGDPLCYGIGSTLLRYLPIAEMTIVPTVSAFSLACARLGWSMAQVELISLCGRNPALLKPLLYDQAQLLILSADRTTPGIVAQILTESGFGQSHITVLERMGGAQERCITAIATEWPAPDIADLNTIAVTCAVDRQSPDRPMIISRSPGLPDTVYHHDGQLTKREVRAVTLSALGPVPGQLLWDVGAGCGSISIEWLRYDRRCQAIAIESHRDRLTFITENALVLGVPHLQIIAGKAPKALAGLPQPDAIFIGGGLTIPGVLETCWQALQPGGRLVANAVTIETEQMIFQWHQTLGGSLQRIAIQRAEPIGKFLGWKALAPVTQWCVEKPI